MKKIYLSVLLLTVSILFFSCLKDKEVDNQKYGLINLNANKIIGFNDPLKAYALLFENKDVVVELPVHLSAEDVSAEDINVTLSLANSAQLVAAYNTANSKSFVNFPANLYTIQNAGAVVTIPKGSRDGVLKIKVNPSTFDPSTIYALGFNINNVDKSGLTISGNYRTIIVTFAAKNKFDGRYTVTATSPMVDAVNPALAGLYPMTSMSLITITGNTVAMYDGRYAANNYTHPILNGTATSQYGSFAPVFEIDVTTGNVLSVKNYHGQPAANGRAAALNPAGVNKYNSATKTLEVSYWMVENGNNRTSFHEKWVYTSARP